MPSQIFQMISACQPANILPSNRPFPKQRTWECHSYQFSALHGPRGILWNLGFKKRQLGSLVHPYQMTTQHNQGFWGRTIVNSCCKLEEKQLHFCLGVQGTSCVGYLEVAQPCKWISPSGWTNIRIQEAMVGKYFTCINGLCPRMVVARSWGRRKWESLFNGGWSFSVGRWKSSEDECWWYLHNNANVLNVTELYTKK